MIDGGDVRSALDLLEGSAPSLDHLEDQGAFSDQYDAFMAEFGIDPSAIIEIRTIASAAMAQLVPDLIKCGADEEMIERMDAIGQTAMMAGLQIGIVAARGENRQ